MLSEKIIITLQPRSTESTSPEVGHRNLHLRSSIVLGVHWKDWWWSWNSNTLATSWEELTHWKKPWCWEGLWAGGEGDDRGWDGWMASPTQWTWVWVNSGSWWWTGRPGVLWFMGSQRVGQDWATELNWLIGDTCANTQNTFVYYGQISLLKVDTDLCLFRKRFPM